MKKLLCGKDLSLPNYQCKDTECKWIAECMDLCELELLKVLDDSDERIEERDKHMTNLKLKFDTKKMGLEKYHRLTKVMEKEKKTHLANLYK